MTALLLWRHNTIYCQQPRDTADDPARRLYRMAIPKFLLAPPLRGLNILMTTLAIFGDSFAADRQDCPDWTVAWPNLLRDQYSVTNYAWSASSFTNTYKQFITHHRDYDRVVVLVTGPTRFGHAPLLLDAKPVWVNGLGTLEGLKQSGQGLLSQEDQNKLRALEMYWIYLQDLAGIHLTAPLMLEEIRRQRPDALLIPCFPWPYANSIWPAETTCMRDLQSACLRGLREDWLCDDEFWNQRSYPFTERAMKCHLTVEGNLHMAARVKEHLIAGHTSWLARWPHRIETDRVWQDYVSDQEDEHTMTNIERFVSWFK